MSDEDHASRSCVEINLDPAGGGGGGGAGAPPPPPPRRRINTFDAQYLQVSETSTLKPS